MKQFVSFFFTVSIISVSISSNIHSIKKRFAWHEESDLYWAEQCDFTGNDIGEAVVPSEQCGAACANRAGCTHFAWTKWNDGTCWLKGNGASQDQAIGYSGFGDYSVCGVMKSPSSSGGTPEGSGKTTRYWDCCKVSCAWNGKAAVSAPVASCQKDGDSILDMDVTNSCDGGSSYTCNSNQPWAIDSSLSYGFAAAKISGKSEGDVCCACYELKFTSGSVNGKRMVVQITNTGAELGSDHFDLQIPAGGVGIFTRGCSSQWNAPANGWGAQYGGISSQSECSQLPAALQPGCNWRFDWFGNSDNPSVDFRRVKCPAELLFKTGCRRNDD